MSFFIIGADEVGTGSAISSIVVCAVRAPYDWNLEGLEDSKKLKSKSEKRLYLISDILKDLADKQKIYYSISERSNEYIDKVGLAAAHKECYIEAVNNVIDVNSKIILDGNLKINQTDFSNTCYKMETIIKADTFIPTVMAAAILAKTYRDIKIKKLHSEYPEYDWENNIGYLTKNHREAIKKFGLTPYHRKSYKLTSSIV